MAAASKTTQEEVLKQLEPLSKALSKSVAQIWRMFVMNYVAKGVGEIFIAAFLVWVAEFFLGTHHHLYMIPFFLVAAAFAYDAIRLLINPYYFAMDDVMVRLKSEQLFLKGK
jgi:hypothetical protein